MRGNLTDFINRHQSLILTTHEGADADGIGAEIVCSRILRSRGRSFRIFNAAPPARRFSFLDREGLLETWDDGDRGDLPERSALLVLDTCEEARLGPLRQLLPRVREVFAVDHHEGDPRSSLPGFIEPSAASTCELVLETAGAEGVRLDLNAARAAFAGISYDTGSFAHEKTGGRTFRAALTLVEAGVNPHEVYEALNGNTAQGALLLQKRVFATLEFRGPIAVQILRKEDLEATGAQIEDVEALANIPLKSADIRASVLMKEDREGPLRCSLRSRPPLNVAKIARDFGGGGHAQAAGFKSAWGIGETLDLILEKLEGALEKL